MDDRIKVWKNDIEKITTDFKHKFDNISEDQLNWKPNPQKWSIAQIIDHLIVTNESYFSISDLIISKKQKLPIFATLEFIPKMFGKMILKSVDPNVKRKVKTFKVFEPSSSLISKNILSQFFESQIKLKNFIDSNISFIESKTIISSPVNRNIVYHFDTVIDIIVNHQKRHFNQAVEILDIMDKEN